MDFTLSWSLRVYNVVARVRFHLSLHGTLPPAVVYLF